MNSMVSIFAAHAAAGPERLFAADSFGSEYSYGEAWESICRAASFLLSQEIRRADRVMAECDQMVHYLLLDMACELIGAVFVPVENNASPDRKEAILRETESRIYIYSSAPVDGVRSFDYGSVFQAVPDPVGISSEKAGELLRLVRGDDTAEILYTTGTTGKSKGIVITNAANVALAENIRNGVCMKQGNVELIPVPVSHSHGLRCCYANLLNGGTIVLLDGLLKIQVLFDLIEKYKVTALDISPSAAAILIKLSKSAFWKYGRELDYIQLGTAGLPETLKQELIENLVENAAGKAVRLYNFYGSTESGRSCVLDFSKEQDRANCIGRPTINSEIAFTDEDRNIIHASEENPGLLASRGKMNMLAYWRNPELTSEIMRDGFIFTNDLGYADAEGYIYVLGRKDDVINYNGIKIAPEEIEEEVLKYPGVKDAACVPMPDRISGQAPRLFICVEDEAVFDKKAYMEYLGIHLDGNKLPKRMDIIDEIPRTFNGKIRRKELSGR